MIKTAAVVNFGGYDSDDDGFFDIRPVVSDESQESTDGVFQPAYQICALFPNVVHNMRDRPTNRMSHDLSP